MGLRAVEENTGWEAALEIALKRENNVQRLINAVLGSDFATAQILAEELTDEEMPGTTSGQYSGASH